MSKKDKYINLAFLAAIGVLIINTLFTYFNSNYLLSLNNYLGFAAWATAVVIIAIRPQWGKYIMWPLLLLSAFNIFNFTIETTSTSFSIGMGSVAVNFPGVNLIFFTLLLIYGLLNRKTLSMLLKKMLQPGDDEILEKQKTMTAFYFEKFRNYNAAELDEVFKHFNDYPPEAQIALKQIRLARQGTEDTSLRLE